MRRIVFCSAVVGLIHFLIISGVVIAARQQPLPQRLALFHLNDCKLPCWIGITPGLTSVKTAEELLKNTFSAPLYKVRSSWGPENHSDFDILSQNKPLFTVSLGHQTSPDTVDAVSIFIGASRDNQYRYYSLADFHIVLGIPTAAWLSAVNQPDDANGGLVYLSPNGALFVRVGLDNPANTPLQKQFVDALIFISGQGQTIDDSDAEQGYLKWHGFSSLRSYISHYCRYTGC
jgi:hypothetical protein